MNFLLSGVVEGDELFPVAQAIAEALERNQYERAPGHVLTYRDDLAASYERELGGAWVIHSVAWTDGLMPNRLRNHAIEAIRWSGTSFSELNRRQLAEKIAEVMKISYWSYRRRNRIYLVSDSGLPWEWQNPEAGKDRNRCWLVLDGYGNQWRIEGNYYVGDQISEDDEDDRRREHRPFYQEGGPLLEQALVERILQGDREAMYEARDKLFKWVQEAQQDHEQAATIARLGLDYDPF